MTRNLLISGMLGGIATYLPFWCWSSISTQVWGAVALGAVSFMMLLATDKKPTGRQVRQGTR